MLVQTTTSETVNPLEKVKQEFNKWLILDDDLIIEIPLACVVANLFNQMPLWMMIIAPPSSAKTEVLLPLSNLSIGHMISKVTPQTFISGWGANKDSKEGCLLHKLTNTGKKFVVMKDFTTILEMRPDTRSEIIAQLREIYDGKLAQAYGNGKEITWEGKLGFLAGVTNKIDCHSQINSMLGERFINFRPTFSDRKKISLQAIKNSSSMQEQRNSLTKVVSEFFMAIDPNKEVHIHEDYVKIVSELADFTAILRTGVYRDGWDHSVKFHPSPETPARLAQQFILMLKSLAIVRGMDSVTQSEISVIKRIACDSAISERVKLLKILSHSHLYETSREISKKVNMTTSTTKIFLEDMYLLGIVSREFEDIESDNDHFGKDTKPYRWLLTEDWRNRLETLNPFEEFGL